MELSNSMCKMRVLIQRILEPRLQVSVSTSVKINGVLVLFRTFSGRFDTSGSMIPRLVPEILPCNAFCDGRRGRRAVAVGIGYSSRLIKKGSG